MEMRRRGRDKTDGRSRKEGFSFDVAGTGVPVGFPWEERGRVMATWGQRIGQSEARWSLFSWRVGLRTTGQISITNSLNFKEHFCKRDDSYWFLYQYKKPVYEIWNEPVRERYSLPARCFSISINNNSKGLHFCSDRSTLHLSKLNNLKI